jgi:hypothetical protein
MARSGRKGGESGSRMPLSFLFYLSDFLYSQLTFCTEATFRAKPVTTALHKLALAHINSGSLHKNRMVSRTAQKSL